MTCADWWKKYPKGHDREGKLDQTLWEPSPNGKKFAEELRKAKLEDFPNGDAHAPADVTALQIKRLALMVPLLKEWQHTGCDVYLRPSMQALYDEVYANTKRSETEGAAAEITRLQSAVIIGATGLGKSRASIYLLKLMLDAGELVIYQHSRGGNVWAFVPNCHRPSTSQEKAGLTYDAFVVELEDWKAGKCAALQWSTTHYLFDPPNGSGSAPLVAAHTYSVCSINKLHYHDATDEKWNFQFYYAPVCSLPELVAIMEYAKLYSAWTAAEQNALDTPEKRAARVRERYYYFGGSLRRARLSDDDAKGAMKAVAQRAEAVPADQLRKVAQAALTHIDGILEGENAPNPFNNTLVFKYMPVELPPANDEDTLHPPVTEKNPSNASADVSPGNKEGLPSTHESVPPVTKDETQNLPPAKAKAKALPKYDFTKHVMKPLSEFAVTHAITHKLASAMDEVTKLRGMGDSSLAGAMFQSAVLKILAQGGKWSCKAYKQAYPSPGATFAWVDAASFTFPACELVPATTPWEVTPLYNRETVKGVLQVPQNVQFPVADGYVGADLAFQTTLSPGSKMFAVRTLNDQVKRIAKLAGEATPSVSPPPPLKIYIVVPHDVFDTYQANPTPTERKDYKDQDKADFAKLLQEEKVQLFVLRAWTRPNK